VEAVTGEPELDRYSSRAPALAEASDMAVAGPDFVLFGIPDKYGGVILFASKSLSRAVLESRVLGLKEEYIPGLGKVRLADRRTAIACEMKDMTMIRGATYAEALRSVLETWQPPELPGLTSG
jgi:hypothetical protein